MFKVRKFYLLFSCSVVLSFFSASNLFSGLLPENVIWTGKNKFSTVQDLKIGGMAVTLDEKDPLRFCRTHISDIKFMPKHSRKATLIELKSGKGPSGFIMVGETQKFYKLGVLDKLKPKLLRKVKRNKRKYLKILLNAIWVNAKDLKPGDRIKGAQNTSLTVKKVSKIKLDTPTDFYDISLKRHNVFFLIDSEGNLILTHNVCILAAVGIGALIGAIIGGGLSIYHGNRSTRNGNNISAATIAKSSVIGACHGVIVAAGLYYGNAFWGRYGSIIIEELKILFAKYEWSKAAIEFFSKYPFISYKIIYDTTSKIDDSIRNLVKETMRREGEDIDFSGIDQGYLVNS